MRTTLLALIALFVLAAGPARADLHIRRDHGGYVEEYKAKYKRIRERGERVIIDGICNSACTLVFGIVPMNKICVTPKASLGFHQAYYDKAFTFGIKVTSAEGTSDLMSYYPDTVIPGTDGGQLDRDQLAWLDEVAARAEDEHVPLLVFGHHHVWSPNSAKRPTRYFGIQPGDSEALLEVVARRPAIRGVFAGHTHRNRVRRFPSHTGEVPFVEVACLKDYPGTWAEYRVYEGGVLQVHRRLSSPEALAWSERCRAMFDGAYPWYALGGLDDRCFALPHR